MPMDIEEILDPKFYTDVDISKQLKVKSNIEEIVVKWATQINEILNEEFKFSKDGKFPISGKHFIIFLNGNAIF